MRVALCVALCLAFTVAAQSRRDDFDPANVTVTETQLQPLSDGGCGVRWCGEIASDDAGTKLAACTQLVEMRTPINRGRCAGLISAGEGRVLRELRFAVDAGVP